MKSSALPGRKPYGIVGDGKASRHLQAYFRLLKVPYILWRRGSVRSAAAVLADCGKIFILITDSELDGFIRRNPFLKGRELFHFSGALEIKSARSLHPFMPFPPGPLSLGEYRAIPFAIAGDAPPLRKMVPEFRNPFFRVPSSRRPLYHALCVLGANLPFILWQKAFSGLNGGFGVPRELVLKYFRESLRNFELSPDRGLTGPLQRKDATTIRANLKALKGDKFRKVYSTFIEL